MGRGSRARTAAIRAVAVLLFFPAATIADEARLTVTFRPGAGVTPLLMELTNAAPRPAVPALTLSGGRSTMQVTGWSLPLPRGSVKGVSLAPRYGEHQLAIAFQPSSLPGLAVAPRAVRGVAVATTGRRLSGVLLAGRVGGGHSLNPLEPAVPQLLAFFATITPRPRLALSPRLVAPLRDLTRHGVDPTLGIGMQADLTKRLTLIGDLGSTRTRTRRWAQTATLAVSGRWERIAFDGGTSHADHGVTLLGPVSFAASNRQFSSVRVQLLKGVSAEGKLTALGRLGAPQDSVTGRSLAFRLDRLVRGGMRLEINDSRARTARPQSVTIEWRHSGSRGIAIQLQQRHDPLRPADGATRRLQMELPALRGAHGLMMTMRSSVGLSHSTSGDPRAATHIAGRVSARRLILSGEMDLDAPTAGPMVRLQRLGSRVEVPLSRRASVQVGHVYTRTDRLNPWRRIEIRLSRSFGA